MSNILIDTCIFIDFIRKPRKDSLYIQLLQKYNPCISLLTHTELYAGKSVWTQKKAKKELEKLLSKVKIYDFTTKISRKAGKLFAHHNTEIIDAIIASTAIEHEIPLATHNIKHFQDIPQLQCITM